MDTNCHACGELLVGGGCLKCGGVYYCPGCGRMGMNPTILKKREHPQFPCDVLAKKCVVCGYLTDFKQTSPIWVGR